MITLEYSTFAVHGRADLDLVVYNPATAADAERIKMLIESAPTDRKSHAA